MDTKSKATEPSEKRQRKELTLADRMSIESGLVRGQSISQIANYLGRTRGTVSKEIKRNMGASFEGMDLPVNTKRNICTKKSNCQVHNLCGEGCKTRFCAMCGDKLCNSRCPEFEAVECELLKKPPYVCNGCPSANYGRSCEHPYRFYNAKVAQEKADRTRKESRQGSDLSEEQMRTLKEVVGAGLRVGQSPKYIVMTNPDLGVSASTVYRYIHNGVIECALDLPEAVRRKPRKKAAKNKSDKCCIPKENLVGREFGDWCALSDEDRAGTVEMDTVLGRQGVDTQCILTLHWPSWHFQLYLLLPDKSARSVVAAIDTLYSLCGDEKFKRWFGVIKTDRGSEFANTSRMERTGSGQPRCRVFYCDAQQPEQKGACERNHREGRRVIAKVITDFDKLTKADLALLMSHLNSKMREVVEVGENGEEVVRRITPIDFAMEEFPELLDALGIEKIPANEVVCNPMLLEHAILKGREPGKMVGSYDEARKIVAEKLEKEGAASRRCA